MLRHSNDSEPGYTRRKQGRAWGYYDGDERVADRDEIDRLNAIALPPAYTDAWFCKDPDGHIQATGKDARGRKQYRYHADYRARRDASKYDGCREFGEALPKIRRRVEQDLKKRKHDRDAVLAAVVRLLDTEHMRIGNEQYARDNNSFGLSTLRSRHVRRKNGRMKMRYVGKHGIVHEATITDASLKRIVGKCQELPGQMLFQYLNGDGEPRPITSADVNDYIREASGGDFTAKHFRTWGASVIAFEQLLSAGERRISLKTMIEPVAEALGNTVTMSRKSYVHPCLIEAVRDRPEDPLRGMTAPAPAAAYRAQRPASSNSSRRSRAGRGASRPLEPRGGYRHKAPMNRLEQVASPVTFDNSIGWAIANRDNLVVGALVAAAIVAVMLVLRAIGHRLAAADPECRAWRGVIGRVLSKTTILFMIAAAVDIVCNYAPVPPRIGRLADILFVIAAAIQAAIWAREIILGVISNRVGDDDGSSTLGNALSLIRILVSVALFAIAFIVILDNLGVNVTALVAGLGIGGIAIGLAAQGIFSDLFAALAIVFDRPFRRGDTIRYGGLPGTTGTVERIGLKTTRLRGITGEQVIMANTKLLEQELHNLAEAKVRRIFLPFALTYRTSPDTLNALPDIVGDALATIKSCRLVRCTATAFGASAIECELVYDDRTIDPDTLARHKSAIIIAIARVFAEKKIDFAYPTQTTYTAAPDGSLVMPWAPPAKPK